MSRQRFLKGGLVAVLMLLISATVPAQELEDEYSIRSWVSEGTTLWSFYNNSINFGNPTSELEYRNTSAHIVEFSLLHPMGCGIFVRGRVGGQAFGKISGGQLYDSDYYSALGAEDAGATQSGAHRFAYTESNVNEGQVFYLAGEIGKQYLNSAQASVSAFFGYQYWEESYSSDDYTVLECTDVSRCLYPGYSINTVGPVITNDTYWYIFYLGGDGVFELSDRFSITGELKFSPIVRGENYDTHVLRNRPNVDFPAGDPSFVTIGNGWGFQAEVNTLFRINSQVSLGLGYRYWRQEITSGTTTFYDYDQNGSAMPAVELYTVRDGWLLSLTVDL